MKLLRYLDNKYKEKVIDHHYLWARLNYVLRIDGDAKGHSFYLKLARHAEKMAEKKGTYFFPEYARTKRKAKGFIDFYRNHKTQNSLE